MNRILAIFIFVFAAIAGSPLKAADIPDRFPDDYTDDGIAVWYPILNAKPISQWEFDFGARYFPSSGKTKINLYDAPPGNVLLSRLTYSNLIAHSGEVFAKVEHLSGFFVKGYIGGGAVTSGKLQDEDFPPFTFPYSSTEYKKREGKIRNGTKEAGN